MTPKGEEKKTGLSRRALIKNGAMLVSGVLFSKIGRAQYKPDTSMYNGKDAHVDPLEIPASRTTLGYGVLTRPYGRPVSFESQVKRRSLDWLTPDRYASISFCPVHQLHGIITPNGLHFERFHGGTPEIDPTKHRMVVHGLVSQPLIYSVKDLKKFPAIQRIHFLECPANGALEWKGVQVDSVQWTHGMMSCCEWTGVKLSVLLKESGVDPSAKWVIAEGADASGMSRSIPMSIAMDDCIVAYAQNGEGLRAEQGYPMRLVVPGCEGNMWIKFLRRLKVTNEPLQHREETSKYTELYADGKAAQFTWYCEANSVITYPSPDFKMDGPRRYVLKGLAWSGRGKVAVVDVSFNGGENWSQARITSPILDKAWVRFEYEFEWEGEELLLMSRATDETGYTQPTMPQLRRIRGTNPVYHRNAMVTWRIHPWDSSRKGEVQNVQY